MNGILVTIRDAFDILYGLQERIRGATLRESNVDLGCYIRVTPNPYIQHRGYLSLDGETLVWRFYRREASSLNDLEDQRRFNLSDPDVWAKLAAALSERGIENTLAFRRKQTRRVASLP